MFKHENQLFHPIEVERPNPQYAVLFQDQLGGGNDEFKAQCSIGRKASEVRIPRSRVYFLT